MELVAILERIIREQGAYFFDHTASGDYAKLVVDTEEGITLDSITELTRAIKDDEKINELFPEGIRLEVTSPGIDYPMTEMFQYRRNIDRPVRVTHEIDNLPNPFEGNLAEVEDRNVTIENKKGSYTFNLSQIDNCRLVIR